MARQTVKRGNNIKESALANIELDIDARSIAFGSVKVDATQPAKSKVDRNN
jgi:hypothetical protein